MPEDINIISVPTLPRISAIFYSQVWSSAVANALHLSGCNHSRMMMTTTTTLIHRTVIGFDVSVDWPRHGTLQLKAPMESQAVSIQDEVIATR